MNHAGSFCLLTLSSDSTMMFHCGAKATSRKGTSVLYNKEGFLPA
ncbi:hypothetical protein [Marinomonas sp. CT5]|nr:hypothetical protein [Marinomonas sp. CT5]